MLDRDFTAQIRQRAYQLWETEGRPIGRERIHWLRAEAEIREKYQPASNGAKKFQLVRRSDIAALPRMMPPRPRYEPVFPKRSGTS